MRIDHSQPASGRLGVTARLRLSALAALLASGVGLAPAAVNAGSGQTGPVFGIWYDETGDGAVELKPCGSKLCGYIVWLKDPISTRTGKPKVDFYNPEDGKRTRPICGLQVLGGLERQPDGNWDNGWVYDPKTGKSYSAAITLEGRSKLSMTGYKGVKFLSKTFGWTRAPAELPRCGN